MSIELYSAFILACIVLALTPGPNMALFIGNGTAYGTRAALLTVLGNMFGLTILVAFATLGMTSIMTVMSQGFDLIRWAGAAYLVWLGYGRLRAAFSTQPDEPAVTPRRGRYVWQGAAVSLSNPKVLLFLGALFPQFVDPASALGPQLALLAATFVVVVAGVDFLLALAVGAARGWFTLRRRKIADGISGAFLIGGGLWLALARRA